MPPSKARLLRLFVVFYPGSGVSESFRKRKAEAAVLPNEPHFLSCAEAAAKPPCPFVCTSGFRRSNSLAFQANTSQIKVPLPILDFRIRITLLKFVNRMVFLGAFPLISLSTKRFIVLHFFKSLTCWWDFPPLSIVVKTDNLVSLV